jgi:hypothetical protein
VRKIKRKLEPTDWARDFLYFTTINLLLYPCKFFSELPKTNQTLITIFLSSKRIVLTGITLASKYLDDTMHSNSFLAKVGGLSAQELSNLELNFAKKLNFKMFLEEENFMVYRKRLYEFNRTDQCYSIL